MRRFNGITATGTQVFRTPIEAGGQLKVSLYYKPFVQMWYMDLEYNGHALRGVRVRNDFNLINQYRSICPFGIACTVEEISEPILVNDFSAGRARLFLLTSQEVDEYNEFLRAMDNG